MKHDKRVHDAGQVLEVLARGGAPLSMMREVMATFSAQPPDWVIQRIVTEGGRSISSESQMALYDLMKRVPTRLVVGLLTSAYNPLPWLLGILRKCETAPKGRAPPDVNLAHLALHSTARNYGEILTILAALQEAGITLHSPCSGLCGGGCAAGRSLYSERMHARLAEMLWHMGFAPRPADDIGQRQVFLRVATPRTLAILLWARARGGNLLSGLERDIIVHYLAPRLKRLVVAQGAWLQPVQLLNGSTKIIGRAVAAQRPGDTMQILMGSSVLL